MYETVAQQNYFDDAEVCCSGTLLCMSYNLYYFMGTSFIFNYIYLLCESGVGNMRAFFVFPCMLGQ
jgi:hypothetical protein